MQYQYRLPYAEGAEISQKAQKDIQKNIGFPFAFFCDFCGTFASSAYGCPECFHSKPA
jgi:hypothetical protein